VVRHASVAAGLGLGWLLLSGPAASASSDLLGTGDLLGTTTSAPVATVTAPVTSTVSHDTTGTVAAAVPTAQSAGSTLVQSTTTPLGSTVEAVPSLAEPVLTAPLAPVVNGTTSEVAQTISGVGSALGGTVSTPLPLPSSITPAVSQVAPVPASGDQVAPVPAAAGEGEAAPPSIPAADQTAVLATSPAATDARRGDEEAAGSATVTAGGRLAWDWSVLGVATSPQSGLQSAASSSPAGSPGEPWSPPLLPDQPMWLSTGTAGSLGGWLTSPATLASAFILVPLLLVSFRNRPAGGLLPPAPAFDPGSTPD
jgi:hypothetical protein